MSLSVMQKESERGSILIIVVAVVMIISVALTFGLSKLKTQDNFERSLETQRKMERIYIELANYVHQNNRLPCPYFPYLDGGNFVTRQFSNMRNVLSGTENLSTSGEAGVCGGAGPSTFGFPWRGVLPFRTLNLNEEDVKDAWGRFFVYGVTEVYTRTYFIRPNSFNSMNLGPLNNNPVPLNGRGTTPATDTQSNSIMSACRTDGTVGGISSANRWVINATDPLSGSAVVNTINLNPQKALFCCNGRGRVPSAAEDLMMVTSASGPFPEVDPTPYNWGAIAYSGTPRQIRHENQFGPEVGDFDTVTVPGGGVVFPRIMAGSAPGACSATVGCSTEGWAFFVASAGGDGIPQSTRGWPYGTIPYGGAGWSPNRVFISQRNLNPASGAYYDDLVLYKTNFDLMNKLNSATCQTPFYSYQR